jgi:hypothetical protein
VANVEKERAGRDGRTVSQSLDHESEVHQIGCEGAEHDAGGGLGGQRHEALADAPRAQDPDQAREGAERLGPLERQVAPRKPCASAS